MKRHLPISYAQALYTLLKEGIPPQELAQIVGVYLKRNKSQHMMDSILHELDGLDSRGGKEEVLITVRNKSVLADESVKSLVKEIIGRNAIATVIEDPAILGGMRIKQGDIVTDISLAGKLQHLSETIYA